MRRILATVLVSGLTLACAPGAEEVADHSHEGDEAADHSHEAALAAHEPPADTLPATVVGATNVAPEYIQHATGLEIIPDIRTALQGPSNTFTHEGNFGPLLFGERIRSFYIRLEPGMFLEEHPHPTESLVFTVSGRWVITSEGKRQVMDFCRELDASGLDVEWKAFGRVNLTDEEMMRAMADSGCVELRFGIESGCDRVLEIESGRLVS